MKFLKLSIGFTLSLFSSMAVSAQLAGSNAIPVSISQPTSNAEALGKYGSFPVGFYTGQPNINVPLYNLKYGGIEIPIALNYDASGIRVDQYPTWVGLGFSLQCGGVITRSVKGMPDDYIFPDLNNKHFAGTEKGYMFCGNKLSLAGATWNQPQFLSNISFYGSTNNWNPNFLADGCPDDFNFNVGGYSGSFFLDETGTWRVKSKSNLGLEIIHEVNTDPYLFEDCASTPPSPMYLNKLITKFVIITPEGNKYTFGGNRNAMDYSRGSQDNFKMFFDVAQFYNITPTAWYLTKVETPDGSVVNLNYERGLNLIRHGRSITAYTNDPGSYSSQSGVNQVSLFASIITPSYLTSIETPFQKIDFKRSFTNEQTYSSLGVAWETASGYVQSLAAFEAQMFNVNQVFNSNQVYYRGWMDFYCPAYLWGINPRPRPSINSNQRIPNWNYKLDSIIVTDKAKNTAIENITFQYSDDESLRLFLYSVTTSTLDTEPSKYSFSYINKEGVPNYNSLQKDHWGYFNGINYTAASPSDQYTTTSWRLPSASLTEYGTLNKITFPTGGTTEFEYELNDYSQYQAVSLNPPQGISGTVSLASVNNTAAGGLRLKKITSKANYNAPPVVKEYFYKKNYITGGTQSSGVLSGLNKYVEKQKYFNPCSGGQGYATFCSDNAFMAWGEADIKTITYSEVTEKSSDGSATVYKYSNYETPGCLDEIHLPAFVAGANESDVYQLTSNEIERGLLLEESQYNNLNNKVAEKKYEYEFSSDRKQKFAKCIRRLDNYRVILNSAKLYWNQACLEQAMFRLYPYKKYYYNVPLRKLTETRFEASGPLTQTTSFTYDQFGSKTSTLTNTSDGRQVLNKVKYNTHADYTGTALSAEVKGLQKLFSNYGIKNYPVEQLTLLIPQPLAGGAIPLGEDKIIAGSINVFEEFRPTIRKSYAMELDQAFYPISYNSSFQLTTNFNESKVQSGVFTFDSRYKQQMVVNAFLSYPQGIPAKPTSITAKDSRLAYTWDYKGQYQTAAVKNAAANQIAFTSFEGMYEPGIDDNKGNWSFNPASVVLNSFTGRKSLDLSGGSISSSHVLASGTTYTICFWTTGWGDFQINLGASVLPVMYTPVKTIGSWKMYSIKVTGNGGQLSILQAPGIGINVLVDEVRLYPEGALMKSYNYDPVTGNVISINDERSMVTFYQYDFLGRLVNIKDEKGSILKQANYQLQSPQ